MEGDAQMSASGELARLELRKLMRHVRKALRSQPKTPLNIVRLWRVREPNGTVETWLALSDGFCVRLTEDQPFRREDRP